MIVIKVAFLLITGINMSLCDTRIEFIKNRNLCKQYPCGDPKPRVFTAEELITEDLLKNEHERIQPPVTVLHRCYSTGCCKNSEQRCMPSAIENVTLVFARMDKTLNMFHVQAINHTQCACLDVDIL